MPNQKGEQEQKWGTALIMKLSLSQSQALGMSGSNERIPFSLKRAEEME